MTFNFFPLSRVKEAWQYRSEPESVRVLAAFFWHALLVLALLVFLFAVWLGIQELNAVSQVEDLSPTSSNAPPALNSAQLGSTLDFYSARQSQYQSLSGSPLPAVADPSK